MDAQRAAGWEDYHSTVGVNRDHILVWTRPISFLMHIDLFIYLFIYLSLGALQLVVFQLFLECFQRLMFTRQFVEISVHSKIQNQTCFFDRGG